MKLLGENFTKNELIQGSFKRFFYDFKLSLFLMLKFKNEKEIAVELICY